MSSGQAVTVTSAADTVVGRRRLSLSRAASGVDASWLIPLFVLFVVKGCLLVAIVGPFTGHDEVDHFYYVARLAHGHGMGVVGEVQLPPAADPYRAYVADYPNNAEVIQPPLYHLLLVPLYWLAPSGDETKLYVLRLASVAIGATVVWLAYLTAREVFPDDFVVRAGTPIAVALQPQFSFEAAIVNHDILVIALSSLLIYLLLRWLKDGFSNRRLVWLGVVGGAGLWTKASFGLALPVVAVGVWLGWRRCGGNRGQLLAWLARSCGLPLLIALPWFVRSLWYYGDPTGTRRLHQIPDYGAQASSLSGMVLSSVFWRSRLEDFWGNYGWRLVPFDLDTYNLIYLAWAIAGGGLLLLLGREALARIRHRPSSLARFQWQALGLLVLWLVMLVAGVLYVGTVQFTQSRFAFPGMIAFALLSVVGYEAWLPRVARPGLVPALFVALLTLTVVTAIRFLIPFYYGASGATVLTR
jgi:4-amino-4-deoxy-L-arabinose transferase-like glycosyltransferase